MYQVMKGSERSTFSLLTHPLPSCAECSKLALLLGLFDQDKSPPGWNRQSSLFLPRLGKYNYEEGRILIWGAHVSGAIGMGVGASTYLVAVGLEPGSPLTLNRRRGILFGKKLGRAWLEASSYLCHKQCSNSLNCTGTHQIKLDFVDRSLFW